MKRLDAVWVLLAVGIFGASPFHVSGQILPAAITTSRDAPVLTPAGKEAEVSVVVSVEASTDPGNPTGIAVRATRNDWWVAQDRAEAVARTSALRQEATAKYARPTGMGGFNVITHELRLANIEQFITADKRLRTGQANLRNLWTRAAGDGLWGVGLGAEALRLDSTPGLAPYLASYIERQGRTSYMVPVIAYWSHDSRKPAVLPRGQLDQLSVEWGVPGGGVSYTRADFTHESNFALSPRVSAAFALSAGWLKGTQGDLSPLTKRYFGGGVGSVRGYESGALGPIDSSGAVTGANTRLTGSAELLWHALDIGPTPIVLSLFYDRGRFAKADFSAQDGVTASSYGLGVSLPVAIGLVRFSFAAPDKKSLRTQTFQFEARANW